MEEGWEHVLALAFGRRLHALLRIVAAKRTVAHHEKSDRASIVASMLAVDFALFVEYHVEVSPGPPCSYAFVAQAEMVRW
jgi:hypothetical protein